MANKPIGKFPSYSVLAAALMSAAAQISYLAPESFDNDAHRASFEKELGEFRDLAQRASRTIDKRPFNRFQAATIKTYGHGDYNNRFKSLDEITREHSEYAFDTLFMFVMAELAGVRSRTDARQRMESAIREIQDVISALEAI